MTMATYSKKSTKETDDKMDQEEAEEERLLLKEGQKASLSDKEEYCRHHGYDFYAISGRNLGKNTRKEIFWKCVSAASFITFFKVNA